MSEEQAVLAINVAWLKKMRADPRSDFLFQDSAPVDPVILARREMIYFSYYSDPLRDWPNDRPAPIRASGWNDCRDAGLVEWGWYGDPTPQFWGIRLTWKGREALNEGATE